MDNTPHLCRIPPGFIRGMTAYVLLIVLARTVLNQVSQPPTWLGVVVALPAAGAAAYAISSQFRQVRRREGVERLAYTDAAAVSFWVTLLAALTYALLEAFAQAPRLSMWVVWILGMITWGITLNVLNRRMT